MEKNLNNHHALQLLQSEMPSSSPENYKELKQSPAKEGKKLYEVMDKFMDRERDRQEIKQCEALSSKGKEKLRDS